MTEDQRVITERQLGEHICRLKGQQAYGELVAFLEETLGKNRERMQAGTAAKAYNELGLAYLQLDDPSKAEQSFNRAVECAPEKVNPRFNRANLALYAQQYDRARELYREVLEIEPDHVGTQFHTGLCFAMTDKPEAALPYFESTAAADPGAMGPQFWAGECLLHMEQFSRALAYFQRAVELQPDHPESVRGAAVCLYELGEYEACITHCDALIQTGGGAEFMALGIKGDALLALGETVKGAQCHLDMAFLDFDAREFLIRRAKRLARESRSQVAEYVETVLADIPELEPAFAGVHPMLPKYSDARQSEQIAQ